MEGVGSRLPHTVRILLEVAIRECSREPSSIEPLRSWCLSINFFQAQGQGDRPWGEESVKWRKLDEFFEFSDETKCPVFVATNAKRVRQRH
mmetsp:Transcript_44172/g.101217  ORF Transcript_44172/g.101217 Transcript_44172/m.101217 type:complete len:91 (+) Transcript_44172:153-425(+)